MSSPAKLSDLEDNLLSNDRGNASDVEGEGYRSDEAIEDATDETDDSKKRRIDPKSAQKKIIRNPQPRLDAERLKGPKGIHTIEQHFEGFKFRGKGYEKSDLNKLMKKLEYWSHRLFPRFEFDDCLAKLETLGTKKPVQTHLTKIRLGMLSDDDVVQNATEENDDEAVADSVPIDEFDALIAEEIEKQRYSVTPQRPDNSIFSNGLNETLIRSSDISATVSSQSDVEISADIQERIERNRQIAIQKRLARFETEKARKAMKQQADEHEALVDITMNEQTPPEEHTAGDPISDK